MKIRETRFLHGPNVWAACPVVEIVLDVDGEPVGDDLPLAEAQTLADEIRKLQESAGTPVSFVAARRLGPVVRAAVEFAEEPVARAALEIAERLPAQPTADDIRRLKALPLAQQMSATVATTYLGARKLGIPVAMLSPEYGGYLFLGHGSKQRRVRWSEPDAVSGVARLASTDKYLTNQLLRSIGIPVPRGKLISSVEEAWPAAEEVGLPVVVKPYNTDLQTGVSLDVRSRDKVEAAFLAAAEHSSWVLVEHFAPGIEHRVVVVGDRVVAVCRIDPPRVIGDGVSTIVQLAEKVNQDPRRGDGESDDKPLTKLKLDDVAVAVLASQGCKLESVPAAGQVVLVRRDPPYFKNGGTLTDLTDVIHPSTAAYAVAAARMMGIPVAGLDVVASDISKPLAEQEGILVEINANPGFWLHLAPWADSPRPVGEEMVRWLFREGDGRIPVVAIVGDSAVGRHLEALLSSSGLRVGTAGSTEMSSAGRYWLTEAKTPQERAYMLFRNPEVDTALFDTDAEELLQHGFVTDRCDVAVLLSPPPRRSEGPDRAEFVSALANALGAKGIFVTTNDWTPDRLGVAASRVILLAEPDETAVQDSHVANAGRAVFVREKHVILRNGLGREAILGLVPAGLPGDDLRFALAAIAAAWALGQTTDVMADYLRSLSNGWADRIITFCRRAWPAGRGWQGKRG
ncbi:MAG TPA: acetate--CoA ligase family protein [Gemmataceae bacterium]|jgi:cyanophycin synthetase|nr:acetate--CoA ligase family protein [Gemmataceae bacterium]